MRPKIRNRKFIIFVKGLLLIPTRIFASTKNKGVLLENFTWRQTESIFKKYKIVVFATGNRILKDGFHLPQNNKYISAKYFKKRVL